MRFLSIHRRCERKARGTRYGGKYSLGPSCAVGEISCQTRRLVSLIVLLCVSFLLVGPVLGQPPGTTPTRDVFPQQDGVDSSGLPIRAFMFLSESDNVVLMPGLSWEEFERLSNPDLAVDTNQQLFSYQSLSIKGEAMRSDLKVR